MAVHRKFLLLLALAALFVHPALPCRPAAAQTETPAEIPGDRERLYDELAADVAELEQRGNLLKRAIELVTPAVVHIETTKRSQVSYSPRTREEAGSGVIVRVGEKMFVLTNRHVVDEAASANINIRLADSRMLHPAKMAADRRTDIAVLWIEAEDLEAARIGDSSKVSIGDFVLAVGSPFGLSHSVTYGIISAKGRRDLELGDGSIRYQDFLQTDAAINPGNSGGPLLNLRGEVIGINTAIASSSGGSEGIGFTIPINMAMSVVRQLVEQGRTVRAYLGVQLNDNFGADDARRLGLSRVEGALVKAVTRGTPAERADLRPDDLVLEFDGQRIEDDEHLIKVVGFTPVGKEVELLVIRGGQLLRLRVQVDDRNKYDPDG